MFLSVVVPCMNEEETVPTLVERLSAAISQWQDRAEIILVDDGSTDRTWAMIEAAGRQYPHVVGIRLSANRGHQIALTARSDRSAGPNASLCWTPIFRIRQSC